MTTEANGNAAAEACAQEVEHQLAKAELVGTVVGHREASKAAQSSPCRDLMAELEAAIAAAKASRQQRVVDEANNQEDVK